MKLTGLLLITAIVEIVTGDECGVPVFQKTMSKQPTAVIVEHHTLICGTGCKVALPDNYKVIGRHDVGDGFSETGKIEFLKDVAGYLVGQRVAGWDWEPRLSSSVQKHWCEGKNQSIIMVADAKFYRIQGNISRCGPNSEIINKKTFNIWIPSASTGNADITVDCLIDYTHWFDVYSGRPPINKHEGNSDDTQENDYDDEDSKKVPHYWKNHKKITLSDKELENLKGYADSIKSEKKFHRRASFRKYGRNKKWSSGASIFQVIAEEYSIEWADYKNEISEGPKVQTSKARMLLSSVLLSDKVFAHPTPNNLSSSELSYESLVIFWEALVEDTEPSLLNKINQAWDSISELSEEEKKMKALKQDFLFYGLSRAVDAEMASKQNQSAWEKVVNFLRIFI